MDEQELLKAVFFQFTAKLPPAGISLTPLPSHPTVPCLKTNSQALLLRWPRCHRAYVNTSVILHTRPQSSYFTFSRPLMTMNKNAYPYPQRAVFAETHTQSPAGEDSRLPSCPLPAELAVTPAFQQEKKRSTARTQTEPIPPGHGPPLPGRPACCLSSPPFPASSIQGGGAAACPGVTG